MLKQELLRHLRRRKTMCRSQHANATTQPRGQIVDAISIRERPASVEDRAVTGQDTQSVVHALTRRVRALPTGLMSLLTWDRGMELAAHPRSSVATDPRVRPRKTLG